jgi:hypothetical protein
MAKRSVHAPAKGDSKARENAREQLHLELIGALAAVNTVASRLHTRSGVDADMATVLFRLCLMPLEKAIAETRS